MVLSTLKRRLSNRHELKHSGSGLYASLAELVAQRQNIAYLQNMHQRLAVSNQAGDVKSAIKGRGIELEEIRAYSLGDDIRDIDWRVTARKQTPYTKVYAEEKDREIYLLLDLSPYMAFGSKFELKSVTAAKAAALIGWLGVENNYQSSNNRSVMSVILKKISEVTQQVLKNKTNTLSNLSIALKMMNNYLKGQASVFVVSSMNAWGEDERKALSQLSKKSRVFCVNVFDRLEETAPLNGTYMAADGMGKKLIFNSSLKDFRFEYQEYFSQKRLENQNFCRRFKIAYAYNRFACVAVYGFEKGGEAAPRIDRYRCALYVGSIGKGDKGYGFISVLLPFIFSLIHAFVIAEQDIRVQCREFFFCRFAQVYLARTFYVAPRRLSVIAHVHCVRQQNEFFSFYPYAPLHLLDRPVARYCPGRELYGNSASFCQHIRYLACYGVASAVLRHGCGHAECRRYRYYGNKTFHIRLSI